MKKFALPALLAAVVVITGCAPGATDAAPQATAPPKPVVTPAPTPTPTRTYNDRGNLPKTVGQTFWRTKDQSSTEPVATFVVNAITVDPACSGPYAEPPKNGHFVKVDIVGDTTPDLEGKFFIGNGAWKIITDAGTTVNAQSDTSAAWSCLNDTERLPSMIGPGEKVTGSLILDVPTEHGAIVLTWDGTNGWEWAY